jgi:pectate lyase
MQHIRLGLLFLLLKVAAAEGKDIPAFPGAEGFGANTPGGRGGKVIFVLNLNDSGPGSLRAACEAAGPRIVLFRVGGIIDLKSPIKVTKPYLTLAGQTAPGDGVCLRGFGFQVKTHDVVVRYLRSRPGTVSGKEEDAIGVDTGSRDVILDHCSATWAVDENLSPSGSISNITVQWCIIAEGLNRSIHHKGVHGYGSLVRAVGGLSLHHNLWANNNGRNPRLGDHYGKPPYPTFDVRNNVIYNYGAVCSGMTGDHLDVNYVANYICPGPDSQRKRGVIVFTDTADARYYVDGNVVDGNESVTSNNGLLFDRIDFKGKNLVTRQGKPFIVPEVRTVEAAEAFKEVLEKAGAILPVRDAVDQRIVQSTREGTGHIIDSTKQVGGWPPYRGGTPPQDVDGDGMPDEWEIRNHLNPNDPADAALASGRDGYTNIEKYLNRIQP